MVMLTSTSLQDRPQRFVEEADRHHHSGEAIRREGYQRQGEGHDGGLNDEQRSSGQFFCVLEHLRRSYGKVCYFSAIA